MTHSERLWPGPGVWIVPALASLGAALVMVPWGTPAVIVAAVVTLALVVAAFVVASPRVQVADGMLTAGRARVDLAMLGPASAHVGADARHERGPGLDARAYLVLRGWVDPVVRVELDDPADPTPYWLISSRHPQQLVRALETGRA